MSEIMQKRIHEDYRELLKTEAGMRILGGIFQYGGLTIPVSTMSEAIRGMHDLVQAIANTVYKVNPYGVADCLTAYEEFMKECGNDERGDDAEFYGYAE